MMNKRDISKYGWKPDLPDFRDMYYENTHSPEAILKGPVVAPLNPLGTGDSSVIHNVVSDPTIGSDGFPLSVSLRASMPPVFNQGQIGSCHDSETEVLTENGWVKFELLQKGVKLATVNPETQEVFYEMPLRLIKIPYSGKMICASNTSLDFKVTPDHEMLVRKWDEADRSLKTTYEFVKSENIGWYCGLMNRVTTAASDVEMHTIKGVEHTRKKYRVDADIKMSTWLNFLGIYIAEGTMLKDRKNRKVYDIQLAAFKPREKDFVRNLLLDMNVSFCELRDRFKFSDKRIYNALIELGLFGVKAPQKFVPEFIFDLGVNNIKDFLLGHFMGDGSSVTDDEKIKLQCHYTSSCRLADDLQRLVFLSGNASNISTRNARTSTMKDGRIVSGKYPEHRISVRQSKNLSIERKKVIFEEHYDGIVYCAEVPSFHTLITRRNKKILISGNCTANAAGAMFAYVRNGGPYSRLQIYYNEREIEGTVNYDAGAYLRDAIQVLVKIGAGSEASWPYIEKNFTVPPPAQVLTEASQNKAIEYSRLVTRQDFRNCLAVDQHPFIIGITVYSSFETEEVARTGIVPMPTRADKLIGGHAVCVIGYHSNFNGGDYYEVRNSWGEGWGDSGNFWIPAAYLENQDLATDSWTIRK